MFLLNLLFERAFNRIIRFTSGFNLMSSDYHIYTIKLRALRNFPSKIGFHFYQCLLICVVLFWLSFSFPIFEEVVKWHRYMAIMEWRKSSKHILQRAEEQSIVGLKTSHNKMFPHWNEFQMYKHNERFAPPTLDRDFPRLFLDSLLDATRSPVHIYAQSNTANTPVFVYNFVFHVFFLSHCSISLLRDMFVFAVLYVHTLWEEKNK